MLGYRTVPSDPPQTTLLCSVVCKLWCPLQIWITWLINCVRKNLKMPLVTQNVEELRNDKVDLRLIFDRFLYQSHLKCHWRSILGQGCNFMELTQASQCLRDPWDTFTVLSNTQISCLRSMTGAFSIIPHVQWNMLWELHAELSGTLKPRPTKSYGLLIPQSVWRVDLPSPRI